MKVKVITIKQPWATLIVKGLKKYEFRSWKTKFRGEIYIHAGKGRDKKYIEKLKEFGFDYPSSKIVGKVNITDCISIDEKMNKKITLENELIYGNKKREGYAWKLEEPKEILYDKDINGKLSLWDYEIVEEEIEN
jgi:ASCH domain.